MERMWSQFVNHTTVISVKVNILLSGGRCDPFGCAMVTLVAITFL